jgi:gliding motility-associated-like protein
MRFIRLLITLFLILIFRQAFSQDVNLYLSDHYLAGKSIIKTVQDFDDAYLWILTQNNGVYRLNTETKELVDWSAQFQSFSNSQITDIVGIGPEWLTLIVKNAQGTQLVDYKNGIFDYPILANPLGGVQGNLVSIGASSIYTEIAFGYGDHPALLISTDKGLWRLSYYTGVIDYDSSIPSRIYSSTYRNQLFTEDNTDTTGVNLIPVDATTPGMSVRFIGLLRKGGVFGNDINTAYFTINELYNSPNFFTPDVFWGSKNGLFQAKLRNSSPYLSPYRQYLNNIKVNKITDIFGLTQFGNSVAKENLLVGTDNGLYYSNSFLHEGVDTTLDHFTLYHYDPLGNVPINFVEVNAKSTVITSCEDGIWVSTNDGFYLIKTDYASQLNTGQQINAIHFTGQDPGVSSVQMCSGDSVTATLNSDVSTVAVQWFKNGQPIAGQANPQMTIKQPGEYYAILYDPCGSIHAESNHLIVQTIALPVFTFNYPDKLQYCENTPVTLKTDSNSLYHYRWYKDDALNGDITNFILVTQSGKYKLEVSACQGSWLASKEVQVDFVNIPLPVISTDKAAYCLGDQATLSIATTASPSYNINWYCNGLLLANDVNKSSITISTEGNYTVTIVNNTANTDGSFCSQTSVAQNILFNPQPVISIQQVIHTTLCDGQLVSLKANYSGGAIKWSTGETTDEINVTTTGDYQVTVISAAGCQASASSSVSFFPLPVFYMNDTTICTYTHQVITLNAPTGFAGYTWNNVSGGEEYQVSQPQKVTLTVTDINGCQTTRQMNVTEQCPDIYIPNAFTPNNDGINDTWKIAGLEYDGSVLVEIFNRYGTEVFKSKGYASPWTGEYHGKKLPGGVYYYLIHAKNGKQVFSGSVTIIY